MPLRKQYEPIITYLILSVGKGLPGYFAGKSFPAYHAKKFALISQSGSSVTLR